MSKQKNIGLIVAVFVVGYFAYAHLGAHNFNEKGTLTFNGPDNAKSASLWKQYKESDGTIKNKESKIGHALVFDEHSKCAEGSLVVSCISMASVPAFPFANHTVVVRGVRLDDNYSVLVRKIIKQ